MMRFTPSTSHQAGFTLVELLAVVVITAIISVVAVGVFVNSQVRGNKARTVSVIRQQGVALTDQVDFLIRGSSGLGTGAACTTGMDELTLETSTGNETTFSLINGQLASNSAVLSASNVTVEDLSFSCSQASGQVGALISYEFTLSVGDQLTSPDSYFSQVFRSQVSIRSY
jgi:prepilin-type N-terminal cleavage/methylation domain-containing protein